MSDIGISVCHACNQNSLWFEKRLLYPAPTVGEPMPADLPSAIQRDFEEARAVAPASARAAAALLRMCVEGLCKSITGEDKFDLAIAKLEAQGIPPQIAMAMDVVRLNGNEVLHAGRLYGDDNAATVALLFKLVRMIVTWAITEKKQLEELYQQIPPEKRAHIEKRRAGKDT